jgi:glutamine cyclotransferase
MHFGQLKKNTSLNFSILFLGFWCLFSGCEGKKPNNITFETPYQGQNFNAGDQVNLKLALTKEQKAIAVKYFLDGKEIPARENQESIKLETDQLPLGYRLITAIIQFEDQTDTVTTNIVLKTSHQAVALNYKVTNSFPHDTSAYTEGLSYVDGKLLESTGEKAASKLKYVDLKSGRTLQQTQLAPQYFGEGSLKINDKIIMLTWQENIGFVFDAKTFKQIATFTYQKSREGWGLAYDGKQILRSDGTNRIWRMNAKTYQEEGFIEVYDDKGALDSLNELEYIDGKIYANVYLTNKIVIINPNTGLVEATIDLTPLVPKNHFKTTEAIQNNVLNGIAWDAQGKRLFVGGKKWPKLYEIKLSSALANNFTVLFWPR